MKQPKTQQRCPFKAVFFFPKKKKKKLEEKPILLGQAVSQQRGPDHTSPPSFGLQP